MRAMAFLGSFLAMAALPPTYFFSADLVTPMPQPVSGKSGKRRRKTTLFPHSAARQRARYARQIAAGQLRMEGC